MKWYCKVGQTSEKSKLVSIDGPSHRSYQHKGRNKAPVNVSRVQSIAVDLTGKQEESLRQLYQRLEFHRRPKGGVENLVYQSAQKEPHPLGSSVNSVTRSPTRVVWLQQSRHQLPKALSLRTRFADAGMHVKVHQWTIDDVAPLECDLILFESFEMFEQELVQFLAKIRIFSQAPLVILTDNHALDWSICALRGGADAIFTVNMPDEVIVARSSALLRRWLPS